MTEPLVARRRNAPPPPSFDDPEPPRRKHRPRKGHRRGFWGFCLKWMFVLSLWGAMFAGGVILWYAKDLPDISKVPQFQRKASIIVKAADGSIVARYGEMKDASVSTKDLPQNLINAVLAIEDRRFYDHPGIDVLGLARAMLTNIKEGKVTQGGSTLTQQLAKNLFLNHERTFKRKIQEAILALWLEHELTKDEILGAYLNRVYFGSGAYGIDAAAKLYFSKPATEVNLEESATLAGLLKAPSVYSPLRNPGMARSRANTVLMAMADAGYITEAQAKRITSTPPVPNRKPMGNGNAGRYFADWVVDGLDEIIGTPESDLVIETTLMPEVQKSAEQAVARVLTESGKEKNVSQAAVVVTQLDGSVVALVGGRDYAASQFNRATQAKRQPGSSFKPFVYLAALEQGWTPESQILDAPILEGKYRPENFDGEYMGYVTLRQALAKSLNTVAVRLIQQTGPARAADTARRMGIVSPLGHDLSLALGSSEASVLEMTAAYTAIANGGLAVYPYGITKITDSEGRVLYERPEYTASRRVTSAAAVQSLKDMMRGVIEGGTGARAILPFTAAGKTGTSQNHRDAWFIGFSDNLTAGVWVGNDDNTPMKRVTGGSLPATIWHDIMEQSRPMVASTAKSVPVSEGPSFAEEAASGFQDLLGRLLPASGEDQQQAAPAAAAAPASESPFTYELNQ